MGQPAPEQLRPKDTVSVSEAVVPPARLNSTLDVPDSYASSTENPGWTVYHNGRYGYELEFPEGWTLVPIGDPTTTEGWSLMYSSFSLLSSSKVLLFAPYPALFAENSSSTGAISEWLLSFCPFPETEGEMMNFGTGTFTANGLQAAFKAEALVYVTVDSDLKANVGVGFSGACFGYRRGDDGFLLVAGLSGKPTPEQIESRIAIAKTFRIPEGSPVAPNFWEDYRSNDFGFSYRLPSRKWAATAGKDMDHPTFHLNAPDTQTYILEPSASLIIAPKGDVPYLVDISRQLAELERATTVTASLAGVALPYRAKVLVKENESGEYDRFMRFIDLPKNWTASNYIRISEPYTFRMTFRQILRTLRFE